MLMQIDFRGQLAIVTSDRGKGGKRERKIFLSRRSNVTIYTSLQGFIYAPRNTILCGNRHVECVFPYVTVINDSSKS